MNPEDIGRILDEIGQRIGPYGEAAWGILVKQTALEGAVWTVINIVLLSVVVVLSIMAAKIIRGFWKAEVARKDPNATYSFNRPDPFPHILGGMGVVLIAALVGGGSLMALPGSILRMLNPEYYALVKLLETLP